MFFAFGFFAFGFFALHDLRGHNVGSIVGTGG
jgi:hypothetical protein